MSWIINILLNMTVYVRAVSLYRQREMIIIFFKCNHKSLKSLVLSNKTRNLIDVIDIYFFLTNIYGMKS